MRFLCFARPARGEAPSAPPPFVSRRIASLVRGLQPRDRREDLAQEIHGDVWKRMDAIWASFLRSGLPTRWSAFEGYLQVAMERSLLKALRTRGPEQRPAGAGEDLRVRGRPVAREARIAEALSTRTLFDRACSVLVGMDWEILCDQHLRNRTTEETAKRLGITRNAVSKRRGLALARFRQEALRTVGEELPSVRRGPGSPVASLVRERCREGHRCLLYKLDCASARTPAALAARLGAVDAAAVGETLRALERELVAALREAGIPEALDACLWEKPGARARRHDDD